MLECTLSREPINGFLSYSRGYIIGRVIKGLDFGDLDLISKVTGGIRISNLDQKRFLCTLFCGTIDGFLLNSHGYIIGMCYFKEKNYLI